MPDCTAIFMHATQKLKYPWILRHRLLERCQVPLSKCSCCMIKDLVRDDKISSLNHAFHPSADTGHDDGAWPPVVNSSSGNHGCRNRTHLRRSYSCNSQEALSSLKNTYAVMDAVAQLRLEGNPKTLFHRSMLFGNGRNQNNISAIKIFRHRFICSALTQACLNLATEPEVLRVC